MYGIFTYIYHRFKSNVGEYNIHGSYRYSDGKCWVNVSYKFSQDEVILGGYAAWQEVAASRDSRRFDSTRFFAQQKTRGEMIQFNINPPLNMKFGGGGEVRNF